MFCYAAVRLFIPSHLTKVKRPNRSSTAIGILVVLPPSHKVAAGGGGEMAQEAQLINAKREI